MGQLSRRLLHVAETKGASQQFDESIDYELPATDFDDCHFSGVLAAPTNPFSGNFRSCTLRRLKCLNMRFTGADILDCHILDCVFECSDFERSHMAGCFVRDTIFHNLKITNINFSQNLFQGVIFENCEFDTFVFKNCKFYKCQFRNCKTRNHTFDSCFFDETQFQKFCVLPSTVLLNVGLRSMHFADPIFLSGRERAGGREISQSEYTRKIRASATGIQEKISAIVFEGNDLDFLVYGITKVLASDDLVSSAISRGFVEKLDLVVSLLNLLYVQNEIIALNLLQLQDHLNKLSDGLANATDKLAIHLRQQIDSLRLTNSEHSGFIIHLLEATHQKIRGAKIVALLGNESYSLSQFKSLLSDRADIEVVGLRQRQSPVAVLVSLLEAGALVWIISVVITTRFHYQIIDQNLISEEQNNFLKHFSLDSTKRGLPPTKEVVADTRVAKSYEVGIISQKDLDVGVRITSAFQSGLIKKFELTFSPKRAVDFQKKLSRVDRKLRSI